MFTSLQYRFLRIIAPAEPQGRMDGSAYAGKSKVAVILGRDLLDLVRNKIVIDFGCGDGLEALEYLRSGAAKVVGIDIREQALSAAARNARQAGLADRCEFATSTETRADVIVSLDAFEHFSDPAAVLDTMDALLAPGGAIVASFGPTWFHPLGGHLFSVFPWAHLLFSEAALIRWRSDLRADGARTFAEVEGGLNRMTIARFERLVARSAFRIDWLETVPIRRVRRLHCRATREFTTAIVRTKLVRKHDGATH